MVSMVNESKLPKRKTWDFGKITVYPDREIELLYKQGKLNGWDTPKIVTEAITKALLDCRELLNTPADHSS